MLGVRGVGCQSQSCCPKVECIGNIPDSTHEGCRRASECVNLCEDTFAVVLLVESAWLGSRSRSFCRRKTKEGEMVLAEGVDGIARNL